MGQRIQPMAHEGPVFPLQKHHVRHGAQAHEVRIGFQCLFLTAPDGGGQLEGYAHAGKILVGVAVSGPVGVHHGHGLGQFRLADVVIGDDQVHAQIPAQLRLGHGGDAAVHSDDQGHSLVVKIRNGNGVQPVAFLQPARDIADDLAPHAPEEIRQQAGGGDAIHVIVAEHGDGLACGQGQTHPVHGFVHVRHGKRVLQGRIGPQIPRRLGRGADASCGEDHGRQWGIASGGQGVYIVYFRRRYIPNSVFQVHAHPINSFSPNYSKKPGDAQ